MNNLIHRLYRSRRLQAMVSLLALAVMVFNPYLQLSFVSNYANATGSNTTCTAFYTDFEQYSTGQKFVTGDEIAGATITVNSNGSYDTAMIFDSLNPTGGDSDLSTRQTSPDKAYGPNNDTERGKVLIISENNKSNDPDDEAAGGTITLEYDYLINVKNLGFLDIEETGGSVKVYKDSSLEGTFSILKKGDNSYQTVNVNKDGINKIVIKLAGSGALTHIDSCIPEGETPYCELVMTKSDGGYDPIKAGENIVYKLTLANIGTGECKGSGVELLDKYPTNQLEYVSYEFANNAQYPYQGDQFTHDANTGELVWNFGTIQNSANDQWNALREVFVTFKVKDAVQCEETIVNKLKSYTSSNDKNGNKIGWSDYIEETTTTEQCPVLTYCGDGIVQNPNDDGINEMCDDGNTNNDDGCSSMCQIEDKKECKLEITKVASETQVNVGDSLEYQIEVKNVGNAACTGVTLTEDYDADTSFVSSFPVADNSAGTLWTIGALDINEKYVATVKVDVTADTNICGETLHNVAKYNSNETSEGQDYADTDIVCPNDCDLNLIKTVDEDTAGLGDTLIYNLELTNTGQRDACTDVVLTENYPAGVTFVSSTPVTSSGNDTWNVGSLNPGETYSVAIEAQVKDSINYCTTDQINKARFNSKQTGESQDVTATTAIQCTPNGNCLLDLVKTDNGVSVKPGDDLVYTLTLTNIGDASCTNVVLEEDYDPNTTFVSADIAPFTNAGTRWNVGSMVPGDKFVVNITTKVATENDNPNICEVQSLLNKATRTSTQTGSASVEETTPVQCVSEPIYDVYLTKTVNDNSVRPGENVNFTITVGNEGDTTMTGVVVKDTLPSELQYVSHATSTGTFDTSSMEWTVGDLTPGQTETLDIEVKVTVEGTFVNNAEVIAHNETDVDSTPNNNIASEDDQDSASVTASTPGCTSNCGGGGGPVYPNINIVKTAGVQYTNQDTTVTYTLAITNNGNATGLDLVVTDNLPSPLTYASSSITGTWNLGDILVGETKTLTYDVYFPADVVAGNYTNIATATISNGNTDTDDAIVEVRIPTVQGYVPLLGIVKSVDRNFTNPSGEAVYTVTVTNITTNNVTAKNVVLYDTLPGIFTFADNGTSNHNWSLGDLLPGESKTIVYTINVSADAKNGTYDNLARASADNAPEVQATVPLEVREVIVDGWELPDTNGAQMLFLSMISGVLMLLLGWMIWKYRELNSYSI